MSTARFELDPWECGRYPRWRCEPHFPGADRMIRSVHTMFSFKMPGEVVVQLYHPLYQT